MTQKEKLIELIDKSGVSICNECGDFKSDTIIERLADFLLSHGCVVFNEDKINESYLPLIERFSVWTNDEIIEAMMKRLPTKPIVKKAAGIKHDWNILCCPTCGSSHIYDDWRYEEKYCRDCGQAIDWSEDESTTDN